MLRRRGGKVARLPLDELNNPSDGNPYGLAMDPQGRYLYIEFGMHRVTILDMNKVLTLCGNSQAELDYLWDDLGLLRDYLAASGADGSWTEFGLFITGW
ncbi:MAG: hypothetical protein R3B44_14905 [Candidatus Brocadiaceae bacterium]